MSQDRSRAALYAHMSPFQRAWVGVLVHINHPALVIDRGPSDSEMLGIEEVRLRDKLNDRKRRLSLLVVFQYTRCENSALIIMSSRGKSLRRRIDSFVVVP